MQLYLYKNYYFGVLLIADFYNQPKVKLFRHGGEIFCVSEPMLYLPPDSGRQLFIHLYCRCAIYLAVRMIARQQYK